MGRSARLKPDRFGMFARNAGYKIGTNGKRHQPKFRLGKDRVLAEIASMKLGLLWDIVLEHHCYTQQISLNEPPGTTPDPGPLWNKTTLQIAEAIRKHLRVVRVYPIADEGNAYAARLHWLRTCYGSLVGFEAVDVEAMATAQEHHAAIAQHRAQQTSLAASIAAVPVPTGTGDRLYQSLDSCSEWATTQYTNGDGQLSATGRNLASSIDRLKHCTTDMALEHLNFDAIESMTSYWAKRPTANTPAGKLSGQKISVLSARNQVKTLRRFLKWLHRSSEYSWQDDDRAIEDATAMPSQKMLMNESEIAAKASGPDSWSMPELKIIWHHCNDRDKALFLFGLNGGFVSSEVIHWRLDTLHLDGESPHSIYIRHKSHNQAGFALWPETVTALQWLDTQRAKNAPKDNQFVWLTTGGKRPNRQHLAGQWTRLMDRVQKAEPGFDRKPLKVLRKTAAQLMSDVGASDVDVAQFQGRANFSVADAQAAAYYKPKLDTVFAANTRVRAMLGEVFDPSSD